MEDNKRFKDVTNYKTQTGPKTEKSSWPIKNYKGKEKKRCSIEEIDWCIMWKWLNSCWEELTYLIRIRKPHYYLANNQMDIVADDGRSIPSTYV